MSNLKLMFAALALGLTVHSAGVRAQAVEAAVTQTAIESFEKKIEELLNAWNAARNNGDVQALAELYRPEDRQAILSSPDRGRSNATVKIRALQRVDDQTARVRFTRSWTGPNAGRVNVALDLALVDGQWRFVMSGTEGNPTQKKPDAGSRTIERKEQGRTTAASRKAVEAPPLPGLEREVSVGVGRVRLVQLPFPVVRVAIGDPSVADFTMVSPTELYVLGRSVGITNMILWDGSNKTHMIDASVTIDLSPLIESISASVPQEKDVRVSAASGSVVLKGSVADTLAAEAVVNLAEAYVSNLNRYLKVAAAGDSGATKGAAANLRVINLLKIRDPQQVMLEVRIAEVSKNLLEKLGISFTSLVPGGEFKLANTVNPVLLSSPVGADGFLTSLDGLSSRVLETNPALGALKYLISGKRSGVVSVDASKGDELVKILAEPKIVALSGKEGSFTAGGRAYIETPVTTGNSPTFEQVEYGVILKFVPTVLDGGRISLKVAPEVSEPITVDLKNFAVRKVSSTVEMRNGETLVIGGLIKSNVKEVVKAFPILGEIPILGTLFRSSAFQDDRTELVVVVSPSLVRASSEPVALPTDNFIPPTRSEFFLGGKMEGSAAPGGDNATR
jgi:pilus assembly protein CpaC